MSYYIVFPLNFSSIPCFIDHFKINFLLSILHLNNLKSISSLSCFSHLSSLSIFCYPVLILLAYKQISSEESCLAYSFGLSFLSWLYITGYMCISLLTKESVTLNLVSKSLLNYISSSLYNLRFSSACCLIASQSLRSMSYVLCSAFLKASTHSRISWISMNSLLPNSSV